MPVFFFGCCQLTYNPTIRLQTQQLFVSFVYHLVVLISPQYIKLSLNIQLLPPLLPQPLQKSTYQKTNRSPNCSQNYCLKIGRASCREKCRSWWSQKH